jgi:hypothetical protein
MGSVERWRSSYGISNNDIKQATTNAGVLHYVQDDDVKTNNKETVFQL